MNPQQVILYLLVPAVTVALYAVLRDWVPEKEATVDGPEDAFLSRKLYLWKIPLRNKN